MREEPSNPAIPESDIVARTWTYVVELVAWLVLCLASALLMVNGWPGTELPGFLGSLLARLAGAGGTLLFAVLANNIVRLLRDPRPALQISEEGVLNRTYSASTELVPWEDILEVRKNWLPTVLAIVLKDPDAFRKRQTLTTRLFMEATSLFGPGPFLVYLPQLRRSKQEVLTELSAGLDAVGLAAGRGG